MKEATEFGIKYLRVMPDDHQEFVMHKVVWRSRESAEKALELLKGVVACPVLVEIWDPEEIQVLNEAADEPKACPSCPGIGKLEAEEPLPEPEPKKDMHQSTYKSNPDGTVDVEIDGQKITDPEKREKARKQLQGMLEDILKDWPWFQDLNRKGIDPPTERKPVQEPWDPNQFPYPGWPIWLWDPRQAPWYTTTTGTGDNFRPANNITIG